MSFLKTWWAFILAGAFALYLVSTLFRTDMMHEGGSWYTTYTSSFPEAGGNIKLYRKTAYRGHEKIADRTYVMHVYPNDCVLYQPGSDAGAVYAACGSSKPRRITFYPPWRLSNTWQATPLGLRRVDPARIDSAGRVVASTETFAIEDIERAALDSRYALEPVIRDEVVDVNTRGRYGRTPLLDAINDGQPAVVAALLRAGADPNVADSGNIKPLQMAVGRLDAMPEIVEALLRAGADPCAPTHTDQRIDEIVIGNEPLRDRLRTAAARCR